MNERQINEYLNGLTFGLKDKSLTSSKYNEYKDEDFKKFISEHQEEINEHLNDLNETIVYKIESSTFRDSYLKEDLTKKINIRPLKFLINNITKTLNSEFIKTIFSRDLNNAEQNAFNIKFYLLFYDKINEEMKNALYKLVVA